MLELHHAWDSFCSIKVRLCLAEKGLPWHGHVYDLMKFENLQARYLALNPHGVVPTLVHDGAAIVESTVINEYLDDAFPDPPLRPDDARGRARMRLWVRHEEEELFIAVRPASLNLMMKQVLGRYSEAELDALLAHHPRPDRIRFLKKMFKAPYDADAVEKSRRRLARALGRMDAALSDGPWLAGETFSLADCAFAPMVDRMEHLGAGETFNGFPALQAWIARLKARPAYGRSVPPDDKRLYSPGGGA